MLEIRNLTKVYRPRRGVPVKALDDVTLTFGDRGLVFLLGKSGSGKSTLLNLLGGLDRYDSGEMIIKGVSAKAFRQRDLDSYRNTYVGFIFQEYNILEEFTVGANIALAMELQGKKATDEAISAILDQVDLAGMGHRKPNELSGGQKQRVAIARALVKNPDIIMADEPTGALDSATGRQVLDTLKQLSKEKLVLVVSHDRDFAEQYADRIVELADGKVIADVERDESNAEEDVGEALTFAEDGVRVASGYRLTEDDLRAINAYLDAHDNGVTLMPKKRRGFRPTDVTRLFDMMHEPFKLIRSKLPMKSAFRIGVSSLKYKKFRLAITLILSVLAFTMFGLSDTFGSYEHISACADSLTDSKISYASLIRCEKLGEDSYACAAMSQKQVEALSKQTGLGFNGVITPSWLSMGTLNRQFDEDAFESTEKREEANLYTWRFSGFVGLTDDLLDEFDMKLVAGRLPKAKASEVAISLYFWELFHKGGYREHADDAAYLSIATPQDLIGKVIQVGDEARTVCGIVDTGYDVTRYEKLAECDEDELEFNSDLIVRAALAKEMSSEQQYSLSCMAFIAPEEVTLMAEHPAYYELDNTIGFCSDSSNDEIGGMNFYAYNANRLGLVDPMEVYWFDENQTTLGEKELLVNVCNLYKDGDEDYVWSAEDFDGITYSLEYWVAGADEAVTEDGWKVVGLYAPTGRGEDCTVVLSDAALDRFVTDPDACYAFAVAPMPQEDSAVRDLVAFCYEKMEPVRYAMQNAPCNELDLLNELFEELSKIFFWIGIFFAAFSGLLLANFIATSITHKKQEIGILRAIGSRGADVFRIFFSESFVIAVFNALASCVLTFVATWCINNVIRTEGLRVTVLHFGLRQVALLLAVSMVVAAVSSFFPVRHIARKRPIDAINNK